MKLGLGAGAWGLVVLALGPWAAGARAQDVGEKVYQHALKSVVWVLSPAGKGKARTGSGSLIDLPRRLVLTNYHVVDDTDDAVVFFPLFQKGQLVPERSAYLDLMKQGGGLRGRVVARDMKRDLALIQLERVPEGAKALKLARKSPSAGQHVQSIGNPGGSDALWVYTSGTVRQVYHKKWEVEVGGRILPFEAEVVMTQSPTNPGDSGGPLLNDNSELVGVTQGGATNASLLSTFIDVTEVWNLLADKKLARLPAPAPAPEEGAGDKGEKPEKAVKPAAEAADADEHEASIKLGLAKQLEADGLVDKARFRYQEIVDKFPKTKAAQEARKLLER